MKLYLSSYRVPTPNDLFELVGKNPDKIKIALIPNAKDYYAEKARNVKIQSTIDYFNTIGIKHFKVVDLLGNDTENLRQELKDCDVIWCMGGNTFCLMEVIQKSGFEIVARELLENNIVYGGSSAGAIVAGITLKGVEFADDPRFAESVVWDGMGLIDKIVVPHVGSEMFGFGIEELKEMHRNSSKLIELTDDQALVVYDKICKVVTGRPNS